MQPDEITTLFDYTYWARDQLMAAAEGLPDEEFLRDRGFTYGGLRGMLVHSMEVEAIWTARFLGEPVAPPLGDELTSVESLKLHWQAQEARHTAPQRGRRSVDNAQAVAGKPGLANVLLAAIEKLNV